MISFIDLNSQNVSDCRSSIEYNIEGLSSLKRLYLEANTVEVDLSMKNLPSLTNFSLSFYGTIDEKIVTRLLDQIPYIEELHLGGHLSFFNLDSLVNLRVLSLFGVIKKNFNFELFKNLSKQLEDINIRFFEIYETTLFKLFDGYNFPYIVDFTLRCFNINRLGKEFLDRLPKSRNFKIIDSEIEIIESDSYSNMQQIISLDLSRNRIKLIEKNAFSNLKNLQTLNLSYNRLTNVDRNFIGLGNSVEVNIEKNYLNS